MIKSFKCKNTKQLFDGKYQKKFSQAINNVGKRKLDMLEASFSEEDLKGFCSIRINEQFKLIFKFENSNAYDVYIDDNHK